MAATNEWLRSGGMDVKYGINESGLDLSASKALDFASSLAQNTKFDPALYPNRMPARIPFANEDDENSDDDSGDDDHNEEENDG